MKILLLLWIGIYAFAAPAATNAPVVFVDVTVIDCTGAPAQPNQTVVVESNRITNIGPQGSVKTPLGATVIKGTGKYLIPGLWDMHVHLLWEPAIELLPLCVANGVTGVRDLHTKLSPDEVNAWRRRIDEGIAVGPRIFASGPIVDGPQPWWSGSIAVSNAADALATVRRLKNEGRDMVKVYERLPRDAYFALAEEAKNQRIPFVGHIPAAITVAEATEAGQKSIEHLSKVWEACCVSEGESMKPQRDSDPLITREIQEALLAAFAGKHSRDRFTTSANEHLDSPDGDIWRKRYTALGPLKRLIFYKMEPQRNGRRYLYRADFEKGSEFFRLELTPENKIRFVEDTLVYDERKATALLALFKKNQTWHCPTFAVRVGSYRKLAEMTNDIRLKFISKAIQARSYWNEAHEDSPERQTRFQRQMELVDRMHHEGIGLLAGTDAILPQVYPGFSLHDELGLLVKAGLSPLAALQTATLNPARFLGLEKTLGTVEKGKLADLVLLEANPLADINNTKRISAVVANGHLFDRLALDKVLNEVEAIASANNTRRE